MLPPNTNLAALVASEPDMTPLGTYGGCAYYELRVVVRAEGGRTAVVGRASDWPVIQRDARIAELEQLLAATTQQAAEAERHAAELASQLACHEAATPAAAAAPAPARPPKHNAYKVPLAQGLLREALHRAADLPLPE